MSNMNRYPIFVIMKMMSCFGLTFIGGGGGGGGGGVGVKFNKSIERDEDNKKENCNGERDENSETTGTSNKIFQKYLRK